MENRGNRSRAWSGNQLRTALVLVSVSANSLFKRHNTRLPSRQLDLHARSHWLTERVLGDECGVAAFGNCTPWISPGALGRPKAFRKCFLCRGHGKLCYRRSNRKFFFANVRRRIAAADYRQAGTDRIRRLPESNAKPDGHDFWNELWNPFLRSSGGWARPHSFSRPSLPPSWRMRCCSRLFLSAGLIANDFSPSVTSASSNCASNGTPSSLGGCLMTDGEKSLWAGEWSRPWRWTHSRPRAGRNPPAC